MRCFLRSLYTVQLHRDGAEGQKGRRPSSRLGLRSFLRVIELALVHSFPQFLLLISNIEVHLLFWQTNVVPKRSSTCVLNRSRAFVVITSGNAANHSIVVGIVGERVLLSLLSYCYLFVIVMPVSVPCCRCYHVWNTLLPQETFLSAIVENLKNDNHSNKKLFNLHWMTHE